MIDCAFAKNTERISSLVYGRRLFIFGHADAAGSQLGTEGARSRGKEYDVILVAFCLKIVS